MKPVFPQATRSSELDSFQTDLSRFVREQSRPYSGLMSWLINQKNLRSAWHRISSNRGANTPGADGQTCQRLQSDWHSWIDALRQRLRTNQYQHGDILRFDVPKSPGHSESRELGILNVADRLIHTAIKQLLEPLVEPTFHSTSFGFRPGRSVPLAVQTVIDILPYPIHEGPAFDFALKLDIADCFDSLDHTILMNCLAAHIGDPQLLNLFQAIFSAAGKPYGWFRRFNRGVCQGSGLSPLLCNLYLHPLDEVLARVSAESGHQLSAFRYADDLLLLARTKTWAQEGLWWVNKTLRKLKLKIKRRKSQLTRLSQGADRARTLGGLR